MNHKLKYPVLILSLLGIYLLPTASRAQNAELHTNVSSSRADNKSVAPSKELLARISLSQKMTRLNYEQKFDSIIILGRNLPFRDSLYLYGVEEFLAIAYFEKGNTSKGFKYLAKAIENDDFEDIENVRYLLKKYKLDSNKAYKDIIKNFDNLHDKYIGRLNGKVMKGCLEIYYTDSRTRWVWLGIDDSLIKLHADLVRYMSDTMNVTAMEKLMARIGRYPGINDIGKSFLANFSYIIEHFASRLNRDTLYAYLKAATLNGQIPNWYGPAVLDKMAFNHPQPLIYGEYGDSGDYTDDGTYIMEPIADIEHVDRRRAEFLLPPLYTRKETQKCILPKGYDPATQK